MIIKWYCIARSPQEAMEQLTAADPIGLSTSKSFIEDRLKNMLYSEAYAMYALIVVVEKVQ